MMGDIERVDLGEVPYYSARTPPAELPTDLEEFTRFTACGLPGVTTTSLAQLAARQGRSVPSEAEARDAVAKELGAA